MGQTVLFFDQKTCFDQKTKLLLCFLTKILLKEKKCLNRSNQISSFVKKQK